MKQLTEFFQDKQVKKVLDVGTGTGDFLTVLKEAFPAADITGIDPSGESLQVAQKNHPGVVFREMTAEHLDFTDNTFDAAAVSMALHHLPDIQKSLAEMQRVVKPGGWIIINELFSDNLNQAQEVHKMYHHFKSKIDRLLNVSHNETFKKEEILEMIKDAGIEIRFYFEFKTKTNLVETPDELESRVKNMDEMLNMVKDFPEYKELKPRIAQFRAKAKKYGFQLATKVVVVGQNK